MKKTSNLLREKAQLLEKKLKEKDRLLEKYRRALSDSNHRIKRAAKDLEESLSIVRDIHKNLLPVKLPQIPGFEFSYRFLPARRGVSGDFFNVAKIKNSMSFGVLLSSCSTYAISSLFLSSFLKFSPRLESFRTAGDFAVFVSKKISASLSAKEKIHLFYGIISKSSLDMDYFLAGNIFAGHRPAGGEFVRLPPSASHLQALDPSQIKSQKRLIQPRDALLFCSPGVAERVNEKGEAFGAEGIMRSVSKNPSADVLEIRQSALFACDNFGKSQPAEKDRAVLALQAGDRALRLTKPS